LHQIAHASHVLRMYEKNLWCTRMTKKTHNLITSFSLKWSEKTDKNEQKQMFFTAAL